MITEILTPVQDSFQPLVSSEALSQLMKLSHDYTEIVSGTRIIGNHTCNVTLQILNDKEFSIHRDFANNYRLTFIAADDITKPFDEAICISGFVFKKGGFEHTDTDFLTDDELTIILSSHQQRLNVQRMLAIYGTLSATFVMPEGIFKFTADMSGNFCELQHQHNFGA
jgi:hypothetical protein